MRLNKLITALVNTEEVGLESFERIFDTTLRPSQKIVILEADEVIVKKDTQEDNMSIEDLLILSARVRKMAERKFNQLKEME